MENTTYDCLVIGGGIFGVTAAIECAKRNYNVGLINPDTIPHHLAASTDVAKAVRMEYGTDEIYFQMAEKSIEGWREWNQLFEEELYHEVGFLMLCKESLDSEKQAFEKYSFQNLQSAGYLPERLNAKEIKTRFPAISNTTYIEASYNPIAGYVESGRVVERLAQYARSLGVTIHEQQTAAEFIIEKRQLLGVKTKEGNTFKCGHAIVAAGAHTPVLLPELQPYMKATGHPIFWLKPKNYTELLSPYLSVFTADISNSGWYGFPYLEKLGIIKIAKHTNGLTLDPDKDDRQIKDAEVVDMRFFLANSLPQLVDAPLVYTRRCLYTDTLDGHFWMDNHPEIKGLSVSTGGSGHGVKMGPILGQLAADVMEEKSNPFLERFRWRHLTADTVQIEEARFVENRKI